eukprot:TRINITY_DN17577_c0_g1_i1.p1 TRINITY_DN17577_c0_g1~~TRINITY_DN17577_c0_g1_i1.p1  ORF type:complete len:361 (-),score=76.47 TRINITY_DN17577_c0_g1_i1:119-1201(-)
MVANGRGANEEAEELVPTNTAAAAAPATAAASTTRVAEVVAVTVVWWSAAVFITVIFKSTAHGGSSLPPFTFTGLVNLQVGLVAFLLSLASGTTQKRLQPSEAAKLVGLGLLAGLEFGFLNKSLEYLTVSQRTMLQNLNVLLLMLAAWLTGLERMDMLRAFAGCLLGIAAFLQGWDSNAGDEDSDSLMEEQRAMRLVGLTAMLISMSCTTVKWTAVQFLLQRAPADSALGQMSKLQLVARWQPIMGIVCLLFAAVAERSALELGNVFSTDVLIRVGAGSLGIVVIIYSELALCQLTSAVACGILMSVHHIPMVMAGVFLFHDHLTMVGVSGFALCIAGGLVYLAAQLAERREKEIPMSAE